jgi:hypothetical protein
MNHDDEIQKLQDRIDELESDKVHLIDELDTLRAHYQALQQELEEVKHACMELSATRIINIRGSDEEATYIASAVRDRFHRPRCLYAGYIIPSPNLIEFGSHAEAVQAGFKPCQTCRA